MNRRQDDPMLNRILDLCDKTNEDVQDLALKVDRIETWAFNGASETLTELKDYVLIEKSQNSFKRNIWRAVYAVCTLIIAAIALYK